MAVGYGMSYGEGRCPPSCSLVFCGFPGLAALWVWAEPEEGGALPEPQDCRGSGAKPRGLPVCWPLLPAHWLLLELGCAWSRARRGGGGRPHSWEGPSGPASNTELFLFFFLWKAVWQGQSVP